MELIISGFPLLVSGLPQPKILLQFARWAQQNWLSLLPGALCIRPAWRCPVED